MSSWTDVLAPFADRGVEVRETDVPAYDEDTVERCLGLCRDNLCGEYGRTWACPPGHTERMDSLSRRFSRAVLVSTVVEGDPKDRELMQDANIRFKRTVREMVDSMRHAGFECCGLCDGGCELCPECAYPEPCRFPDRLLPSVSAVGVDMGAYLESVGEKLEFRNDRVAFYAVVLFNPLG